MKCWSVSSWAWPSASARSLVEYLVIKPRFDGRSGSPQHVAIQINEITTNVSRTTIRNTSAPPASTGEGPGDDPLGYILIAVFTLFITAGVFLRTFYWVVGAVVGMTLALAVFALFTRRLTLLLPRHLSSWVTLSVITTGVAVAAMLFVVLGRFEGRTIGELRAEVSHLGIIESITTLSDRYDSNVVGYLGLKALGTLGILFTCLVCLFHLVGVTVALRALARGSLGGVSRWLIVHTVAGNPQIGWRVVAFVIFWLLTLLTTSGLLYEGISNLLNNGPLAPSTPPTPAVPGPTTSVPGTP